VNVLIVHDDLVDLTPGIIVGQSGGDDSKPRPGFVDGHELVAVAPIEEFAISRQMLAKARLREDGELRTLQEGRSAGTQVGTESQIASLRGAWLDRRPRVLLLRHGRPEAAQGGRDQSASEAPLHLASSMKGRKAQ